MLMGDMGDMYREMKEERRDRRRALGIDCPGCIAIEPKRNPTILLPGQRCRYCGHKDQREDTRR